MAHPMATVETENTKRREGIETQLPFHIIQHMQLLLTSRDAARSSVLSKLWLAAWSARPFLEFDQVRFVSREYWRVRPNPLEFLETVMATLESYAESKLNIDRFALRTVQVTQNSGRVAGFGHVLGQLTHLACAAASTAVKMGVPNVSLDFHIHSTLTLAVPEHVLQSGTLIRLSLQNCSIDGGVQWPNLKSLTLAMVRIKNFDEAMSSISSSCASIEEFTVSDRHGVKLTQETPLALRNLKRFILNTVAVEEPFFSEIESQFPCLIGLSINACIPHSHIQISSTTIQKLRYSTATVHDFHLNLPKLSHFCFKANVIPSITLEDVSKELECDIHITCLSVWKFSSLWYHRLRDLLYKLRMSKIDLSLSQIVNCRLLCDGYKHRGHSQVGLRNLRIEETCGTSYMVLPGLFSICRPKLVTYYTDDPDREKEYSFEKSVRSVRDQSSRWRFDVEGVEQLAQRNTLQVSVGLKWR